MAVFQGTFADGSPLFGSFDAKYKNFGDKQSFPWVLEIVIRAADVSDDGLPTVEENVVLNDFEDSIVEMLSQSTAILFFGHITGAGARLAYCYLASPNPAYDILTKFCAGKPMRELRFEIDRDPEWLRIADIASADQNHAAR